MISIIIPCYNEANNLNEITFELIECLARFSSTIEYEIIFADDHSTDESPKILEELHQKNKIIRYLRLSKNCGSHTAIRAGLSRAWGKCAIVISADGQDNPQIIGKMIEEWQSGSHIVWALRKTRREPFLYNLFSKFFYQLLFFLNRSSNINIDLSRADFYLLDRKVIDALNTLNERNTSLFGIIAWIGFTQKSVEYDRRERRTGKSNWNFKSRAKLAVDWIMAFSGLPLRITTYLGICVSILGFAYAIFIFFYTLIGNPLQGWASLIIVVLILDGFILLFIGISGEYLWRVLEETRKRPPFFIENESTDSEAHQ